MSHVVQCTKIRENLSNEFVKHLQNSSDPEPLAYDSLKKIKNPAFAVCHQQSQSIEIRTSGLAIADGSQDYLPGLQSLHHRRDVTGLSVLYRTQP